MKALRLVSGPHGATLAADLPLRMPQAAGVIDPEPFRRRSIEGPALAEAFAVSGGLRTAHLPAGSTARLFDLPSAVLSFVISGTVALATGDRLGPGDLFLAPAGTPESAAQPEGDCRLVQVLLEPDCPEPKARPVSRASTHPRGSVAANFKRMTRHADGRSRFHPFPALFGAPGVWSPLKPVIGLRFIGMAEDTFIDWHPEIVNNLVIVLTGALELETGGDGGAVEVFREGDVCLAQDRTGEGHIDRMHGHVQVAVVIIDDAELWPLDAG